MDTDPRIAQGIIGLDLCLAMRTKEDGPPTMAEMVEAVLAAADAVDDSLRAQNTELRDALAALLDECGPRMPERSYMAAPSYTGYNAARAVLDKWKDNGESVVD